MKGFPKHLNSKADYYYIKDNFPEKKWRPYWQALLDERFRWMDDHVISGSDEGITDETHRVSSYTTTDTTTGEEVTVYVQQEYKKNPGSDFWRMGFTVEEVEKAMNEETENG